MNTLVKNSRWDFWKEGVSSSLLSTFITCREQFRLSVVEGWKPQLVPLSMSFGTCVHWCLEQAYAKSSPPGDKECQRLVSAFEKLWTKENPGPAKKQLETQEMAYGLAEAVLPYYFVRWAGDFPGEKYPVKVSKASQIAKWVSLENEFSVPYKFEDGKETKLRGARDGIYVTQSGNRRVFDTKCLSVINEEDLQDTLTLNLQQMFYLWVVLQEPGKAPTGTTMNIIRRPGHRQRKTETMSELFKRVKSEISKPKSWDHYFFRVDMDISPQEVKSWERSVLNPIMRELRGWWEGKIPHYANPGALVTKYGRAAMFNPIVFNNFNGLVQRPAGKTFAYQTSV